MDEKPFEQWSLLGMGHCPSVAARYGHCQAGKLKFSHGHKHSETGDNGLLPATLHNNKIQGQNDPHWRTIH
jgi:hypothetical protein